MRMVLETLRHHKFYAKASKYRFCRSSVGFLSLPRPPGHVISGHGVAVDHRMVAAVAEWAPPLVRAGARFAGPLIGEAR